MKIVMVSATNLNNFPNLSSKLQPSLFLQSKFDSYEKIFADLTLQVEKEIFINRKEIDLIFFANEDELDFEKFQSLMCSSFWSLDNSIFFTKTLEHKQTSMSLWQKDYIQIANSNFFCRPEIFGYLHVLNKIPMHDIFEKAKEFNPNLEITPSIKQCLHIFHLATILNISINHLVYDR